MPAFSQVKVVLVRRKSRLEELVARFNSVSQARFYIEHLGADFSDYELEHTRYATALASAASAIQQVARLQVLDRAFLPNFLFNADDVVVAIGQDGLVANTLKYLEGQPLLGVNPDPQRWDGVLLPFGVPDLGKVLPEVIAGKRPHKAVTMAAVQLNNGQSLYAVNDLFIGQKTHVSARYQIQFGAQVEAHSSSGIIVSTGLGATGWLKSVLAGAAGITAANMQLALPGALNENVAWDSDALWFSVREPFPSQTTGASLVFGKITPAQPLEVRSRMAENGVIFSDGIESDFLEFNSGATATITIAQKKGILVI